jgi:hypothetical protein
MLFNANHCIVDGNLWFFEWVSDLVIKKVGFSFNFIHIFLVVVIVIENLLEFSYNSFFPTHSIQSWGFDIVSGETRLKWYVLFASWISTLNHPSSSFLLTIWALTQI